MTWEIRRVPLWPLVKLTFVVSFAVGLVGMLLYAMFLGAIVGMLGQFISEELPIGALTGGAMIAFGIFGALFIAVMYSAIAAIGGLIYNATAGLIGGIELEIQPRVAEGDRYVPGAFPPVSMPVTGGHPAGGIAPGGPYPGGPVPGTASTGGPAAGAAYPVAPAAAQPTVAGSPGFVAGPVDPVGPPVKQPPPSAVGHAVSPEGEHPSTPRATPAHPHTPPSSPEDLRRFAPEGLEPLPPENDDEDKKPSEGLGKDS